MSKTEDHIQSNLNEFYSRIGTVCGLQSEKNAAWAMVKNRTGYWPNLVYGVGADFAKQQNQNSFLEKNESDSLPNLVISNDQNIQQTSEFLRVSGFLPITSWKGMALQKSDELEKIDLPEQIRISKPDSEEELDEWIQIVNDELLSSEKLDREQLKMLLNQADFDAWMLKKQNEVVSTILVFRSKTASGLYFIATKKTAQRNGFASLLIRFVCAEEQKKSEKPLVLHATRNGESVYSRLGFKPYNSFYLYWKVKKKT